VFISCGQSRGSEEVEIVHKIGESISKLGYDPYIAIEEQTLRGVKENIFKQLETSEYFIFIDFKREKLVIDNKQVFRGSLFCHQELALASYLGIPLIAFQEKGVKREDGLMRFLQGNSIIFTDRHLLPDVIASTIQQRKWSSKWKNQLCLVRESGQFVDVQRFPENVRARFFHIGVENLHPHKMAVNCYVYLERVYDISNDRGIPVKTIEFKWRAYTHPNAVILPKSTRDFDAFWISHDRPDQLKFNLFTDSTGFIPRISGLGDFKLTYTVISENFPPVRGTFILHTSEQLEKIQFKTANPK